MKIKHPRLRREDRKAVTTVTAPKRLHQLRHRKPAGKSRHRDGWETAIAVTPLGRNHSILTRPATN